MEAVKADIGPVDSYSSSSSNGIQDFNKIIAQNKELRAKAFQQRDLSFGNPTEKKNGLLKRGADWYVENVDVPGPYGSPEPKDWPKRNEAHHVGKWNDQVNFVSKNGTTAEKVIQRGALVTGVAAAGTAVAVGTAEALVLGNESITVHGALAPGAEPSLAVRGQKFFRVNATGDWWRPTAWGRYKEALKSGNPKNIANTRYNLRPHYHRKPINRPAGPGEGIKHHRPWQNGW